MMNSKKNPLGDAGGYRVEKENHLADARGCRLAQRNPLADARGYRLAGHGEGCNQFRQNRARKHADDLTTLPYDSHR